MIVMQGPHAAVLGFKGNQIRTWQRPRLEVRIEACFHGNSEQRAFGRRTINNPAVLRFVKARLGAQNSADQQVSQELIVSCAHLGAFAADVIARLRSPAQAQPAPQSGPREAEMAI